MRLCLSLLQLVLLAFLLSNCQTVTDASTPLPPSAPPNTTSTPTVPTVVITGEADGAPPGCNPEQLASRFMELLQAWNTGDTALVPAFFGIKDGTPFQWYSMDRVALFHLTDLHHYVQGRVAQHEQMHLQAIQVNGWDAGRGLVHFGPVELLRTADDLPAGSHVVQGKGAYDCDHHRFVVLSLATDVGTSTQPAFTLSLEASIPPDLIYATDVVSTLNALDLTIQAINTSVYASFFDATDRAVFVRTDKGVVEVVFFSVPLDDALGIEMMQEGDRYIYVLSGPVVGPVPQRIDSNRPLFFITGDTLLLATDTPELAELLEAEF